MTRAPKLSKRVVGTAPSAADADKDEIVQVKIWLLGISPMVWLRLLMPSTHTLRELHGVIQVAMEWEGIDLYQFWPVRTFAGFSGEQGERVTRHILFS